jgi:Uma2 family endonuclease
MSLISTTKMTARQFATLEDPPGLKLELVKGEVAVSPSPLPRHSHVDTQLRTLLNNYVLANDLGMILGDVDTIFGEYDVRRPDIVFFQKRRQHLVGEEGIEGPPDLCIEIISKSSQTIDRKDKFEQYAAGKVRYYWIVDPKQRIIEAFRLRGENYIPAGRGQGSEMVNLPPFSQLQIPLSRVWFPSRKK